MHARRGNFCDTINFISPPPRPSSFSTVKTHSRKLPPMLEKCHHKFLCYCCWLKFISNVEKYFFFVLAFNDRTWGGEKKTLPNSILGVMMWNKKKREISSFLLHVKIYKNFFHQVRGKGKKGRRCGESMKNMDFNFPSPTNEYETIRTYKKERENVIKLGKQGLNEGRGREEGEKGKKSS